MKAVWFRWRRLAYIFFCRQLNAGCVIEVKIHCTKIFALQKKIHSFDRNCFRYIYKSITNDYLHIIFMGIKCMRNCENIMHFLYSIEKTLPETMHFEIVNKNACLYYDMAYHFQ